MIDFPGKEFLAALIGPRFWRDTRCLFVLSTGRVGTVSLTSLLGCSRGITAFHEAPPALLEESKAAYTGIWEHPKKYEQIFRNAKARSLGTARLKGRVYADTSNRLTFFAPVIARLLPNSCFIHLHRHPADVVRSGMSRRWYRDHSWDVYRIEPAPDNVWAERWHKYDAFAKNCWLWAAVNEFALIFRRSLPDDRFLTVKYEELFRPFSEIYRCIFDFIGVKAPPSEQAKAILETKRNVQKVQSFPRYDEWNSDQVRVLNEIAGPTASRLGYDLTRQNAEERDQAA
jgi:hypothetical protein